MNNASVVLIHTHGNTSQLEKKGMNYIISNIGGNLDHYINRTKLRTER